MCCFNLYKYFFFNQNLRSCFCCWWWWSSFFKQTLLFYSAFALGKLVSESHLVDTWPKKLKGERDYILYYYDYFFFFFIFIWFDSNYFYKIIKDKWKKVKDRVSIYVVQHKSHDRMDDQLNRKSSLIKFDSKHHRKKRERKKSKKSQRY